MPVPIEKGKTHRYLDKRQGEAHDLDGSQNRPFCFCLSDDARGGLKSLPVEAEPIL